MFEYYTLSLFLDEFWSLCFWFSVYHRHSILVSADDVVIINVVNSANSTIVVTFFVRENSENVISAQTVLEAVQVQIFEINEQICSMFEQLFRKESNYNILSVCCIWLLLYKKMNIFNLIV